MRVLLIATITLLIGSVVQAPTVTTTRAAQADPTDFTRPDVAPLTAQGKFQVVSDTPWTGSKVRVFFLGAQF